MTKTLPKCHGHGRREKTEGLLQMGGGQGDMATMQCDIQMEMLGRKKDPG